MLGVDDWSGEACDEKLGGLRGERSREVVSEILEETVAPSLTTCHSTAAPSLKTLGPVEEVQVAVAKE